MDETHEHDVPTDGDARVLLHRAEPWVEPEPAPSSRAETAAVGAAVVAAFAFIASIFAVGLAARAVTEGRDSPSAGGGAPAAVAGAGEATPVGLGDFSIDPGDLSVGAGGVLGLDNQGAVVHNLNIDGTASEMIDPGGTGELDISGLAPGTYDMWCDVPGHKEAGMKGTITID